MSKIGLKIKFNPFKEKRGFNFTVSFGSNAANDFVFLYFMTIIMWKFKRKKFKNLQYFIVNVGKERKR